MRLGAHVMRLGALAELTARGALPALPEPFLGVVDFMRALEGLGPEPAEATPLGIVGLDALLAAAALAGPDQAERALRGLRGALHEARGYFEWRRIPLVLLVRGALEARSDGGATLALASGPGISLDPLLGRGIKPMSGSRDWWWAPQLG